jgi:two-component system chemotaxis sensor kinase CheA
MDKQQLLATLMSTFAAELDENLRLLNRELLFLEKNPTAPEQADSLAKLFRAAHSLKGAARSVNQTEIEFLCHQLEDKLAALRDSRTELNPETISGLFPDLDRIEQAAKLLKPDHQIETNAPVAAQSAVPNPAQSPFMHGAEQSPANGTSESAIPAVSAKARAAEDDSTMVRVSAHKLDALLTGSGELLVARRRIAHRGEQLAKVARMIRAFRTRARHSDELIARFRTSSAHKGAHREVDNNTGNALDGALRQLDSEIEQLSACFASDVRALEQAASAVEEEIRQIRMLPFAECCQGIDRMLRDLSQSGGKQAELVIEGDMVELDRAIIEQLRDPLRQLARNAIGHGIETTEDRLTLGKAKKGRISISALTRGAHVEITVSDDGRGLDLDNIRTHAQGRLGANASPAEIAQAIFLPGVSTASKVNEVSGRGVGLDIVKSHIEALRGTVSVSWTPGAGTTFLLTVPLTLTIMRALLLRSRGQIFALPNANVRRLLRFNTEEIRRVANQEVLMSGRGQIATVAPLSGVLGLSAAAAQPGAGLAVIVGVGNTEVALTVDEFLSEQDLMVKTLGRRIRRARMISGASLLPSGEVALVLNVGNLVRTALGIERAAVPVVGAAEATRPKRLIVADDSVTTLSLEKSILEGAGYDVKVAANGQAAWELLQAEGADLLVSDVQMPKLDGFGLTAQVRGSQRFHELPIVLVTARETDADKTKGLELGADAYLVKSAFDQDQLLKTIAQLL